MKILLVEDDRHLIESLTNYLSQEGFKVVVAKSLSEAKANLFGPSGPAIILLDWMLPDGQGLDFLRALRQDKNETPVIMLTARVDLVDKVLGLETGANDYITKPFEPRELVARIRAQLRSAKSGNKSSELRVGPFCLNSETMEVSFAGTSVELTKIEFHLLKLFLENPNRVFSREALLNEVWGYESYPTTRTVDNHIMQLRHKFNGSMFETVRGIGYRLRLG
jgi:DNA-binding response OmpR family regulator